VLEPGKQIVEKLFHRKAANDLGLLDSQDLNGPALATTGLARTIVDISKHADLMGKAVHNEFCHVFLGNR
jgi:hypothetical protein